MVITGVGPNSLGEALALAIGSQQPAKLFLASRTESKVQQVADKVKSLSPGTSIEVVALNLASQKSIHAAASKIQSQADRVDILINNAGMMVLEKETTEEGIEIQFGTNHIGHFLFTNLLMDQLKHAAKSSESGSTRVVNVTSAGHRLSPLRFHDYNFEGKELPQDERPPDGLPPMFSPTAAGYNGWLAYGQSKTANILFTVYLTQHLESAGIVSYSVHPGCKYLSKVEFESLNTDGMKQFGPVSVEAWTIVDMRPCPKLATFGRQAIKVPRPCSLLHSIQL